jgi:hypothetical protein
MHPAPIGVADRTEKKFYWLTVLGQHCLLAEGDIGAPIYWSTDPPCTPTLLVLERNTPSDFLISCNKFHIAYWRTSILVRLAYFHPNRLFTNRKRKYVEEKTTATLKSKQTSIATVRKHLRTVASLPTPLSFHYPLPLRLCKLYFTTIICALGVSFCV